MFTKEYSLIRKSVLVLMLLSLLSIGTQVFAEQQDANEPEDFFEMSLEELMEVEVSVASRKESTQREAPGIVTVITRDEIRKSGARDLIDILRLVPGFDVTYDTEGAYGVSVRGIWANEGKVLVLMDGVEMNDDMYGTFQFGHHIPVDIIERIEIMRGPGSVMYGEFAELGVISIITISPETEGEGFVSSTYSRTNGTFDRKNVTGYYGMKKDDFSFSVASHYGRGNFSDGISKDYDLELNNSVDMSENNNSLVTSPFINMALKKGNFSARYIYDRYGLNYPWPDSGSNAKYRKRFHSDILEGKYQLPISDELSMTSRFVYKHQKPWTWPDSSGISSYLVTSDKYKGENYFSYDLDGGHNIVVGVSYEQINGRDDNKGGSMNYAGTKNKISYYNAAVYGEAFFKTPYGNLTIGGRQVKHNFAGGKFVPRFALTKQLGDYHIKAIYSQAYRSPNIQNIAYNPEIKPESTTIYELELGRRMSDNWLVTANVFDVEIHNPIIWSWANPNYYYENHKKTASRGVEVSSIYKKGTSNLTMTYSYYIPRENEVGPYSVPGHSKTNLGVANHKFTLLASFSPYKNVFVTPSLTYHSSKYGVADYDDVNWVYVYEKLDPTLVANLSLLFKDLFNKKGMDLSFTVHNLFDEKIAYSQAYAEYHGLIPGPSRAFTMNLRYAF